MRIAYLDCASGISGDMTLGALVDAGVDLAAVQAGIDSLGLLSCRLVVQETKKCGFRATQLANILTIPGGIHLGCGFHHMLEVIQKKQEFSILQIKLRMF